MRMRDERDGDAKLGSIGQQTDTEHKDVPRATMSQMQVERVIQTEDSHYGRADSDVVMTRNEGQHRDEERVHESRETACCKSSRSRVSPIAHDLARLECDHDEEQADQRSGSL